jgi:signal transduction histidine kinase
MTVVSVPLTIDKVGIIRRAFPNLDDEELGYMDSVTRVCNYPAGYILCREGEYEDVFYIIAHGQATITIKISDSEGERTVRNVGQGDVVGEMALIQDAPRAATVRALTDCAVLEMRKPDFEAMLQRSPRMALSLIRSTLDRMRANDQMAIQDLQRTNKVLRMLDRNKLEFIQVAAHELRTPLTVLKGYVNVLKLSQGIKGNAALTEVLEGIEKGADRMHGVVNAMLDVTRIDSDNLRILPVPVPLKSVINDVATDLQRAADAASRALTITTAHDPDTPNINADPTLIQKALHHLVVNAIKYTPDGGAITISTRPVILEDGRPGVEISVKDTGIGLDREHQELVFEKFYQVGSVALHSSGKVAYKAGGSGLGLAIVRGVARAHGGKVWAESAGHDEVNFPGSIFFLQLPVNPSASPAA